MPDPPPNGLTVRQILCPVDTSPFSRRALQHGVALARWYDAEVVALFVREMALPPSLWLGQWASLPAEVAPSGGVTVEWLAEFVERVVPGRSVRPMVTDGRIAPEILRVARELPADLIVMGTHGLSGFDRLLLGSVTEKVLRRAECPILTVPALAADAPEDSAIAFNTIVCGVDQSPSSRRALAFALSLAHRSQGCLTLVHVLEDFSQEEPRFASHVNAEECWRAVEGEIRATYDALVTDEDRRRCRVDVRTPRGKAYRELLAVAGEVAADLIVVGTAGTHMPFGATAQHVLRGAHCPVLAVPEGIRTDLPRE